MNPVKNKKSEIFADTPKASQISNGMNNIIIIGAGQIGSRHLQALKNVKFPLNITVIDPSQKSLAIAKRRYEEIPKGKHNHAIKYLQKIDTGQKIDLVIVATTSDVRAKAIKDVLKNNQVRYFILEKILFDKKSDYYVMEKTFSKLKIKAWVNLPRRVWPVYQEIKRELAGQPIFLKACMGQWDLACNAIHFLDLTAFLAEKTNFKLNVSHLDKKLLLSRRKDFLEFRGTLYAGFDDGSSCEFTSYISGNAPFLIEIFNKDARYIIRESEGKYWASNIKNNWQWEEISFRTPLVSETTTETVENILANGNCSLTPYKESVKIHVSLLEPLKHFLNENLESEKEYEHYPFT